MKLLIINLLIYQRFLSPANLSSFFPPSLLLRSANNSIDDINLLLLLLLSSKQFLPSSPAATSHTIRAIKRDRGHFSTFIATPFIWFGGTRGKSIKISRLNTKKNREARCPYILQICFCRLFSLSLAGKFRLMNLHFVLNP